MHFMDFLGTTYAFAQITTGWSEHVRNGATILLYNTLLGFYRFARSKTLGVDDCRWLFIWLERKITFREVM